MQIVSDLYFNRMLFLVYSCLTYKDFIKISLMIAIVFKYSENFPLTLKATKISFPEYYYFHPGVVLLLP